MKFIESYLSETINIVQKIDRSQIEGIINNIKIVQQQNGRMFFIGVGGGAGHASHAVNDFRKICGIESYSPSDNVSELTARINDEGWSSSYKEWLIVSNLSKNDALFILSVGGGNKKKNVSTNLITAIDYAKKINATILGIIGKKDGYARKVSKKVIVIPEVNKKFVTPYSEAFQAVIWHCLVSHPLLQINKTKW